MLAARSLTQPSTAARRRPVQSRAVACPPRPTLSSRDRLLCKLPFIAATRWPARSGSAAKSVSARMRIIRTICPAAQIETAQHAPEGREDRSGRSARKRAARRQAALDVWNAGCGPRPHPVSGSDAVVHVEFHRVRRVLEAMHFFDSQIHVGVDQVVREHVALLEEGAVRVEVLECLTQ